MRVIILKTEAPTRNYQAAFVRSVEQKGYEGGRGVGDLSNVDYDNFFNQKVFQQSGVATFLCVY